MTAVEKRARAIEATNAWRQANIARGLRADGKPRVGYAHLRPPCPSTRPRRPDRHGRTEYRCVDCGEPNGRGYLRCSPCAVAAREGQPRPVSEATRRKLSEAAQRREARKRGTPTADTTTGGAP